MAYCPDTKSLIYTGTGCQLWILDLDKGQWRKAMQSPPEHGSMGRTIVYDPSKKRMLIVGGGRLDAWTKGKSPEPVRRQAHSQGRAPHSRAGCRGA